MKYRFEALFLTMLWGAVSMRAAEGRTDPPGAALVYQLPAPEVRFVTKFATDSTSQVTTETIVGLSPFPIPGNADANHYGTMRVSSVDGTATAEFKLGANPEDPYFPHWKVTYTGIYGVDQFPFWEITTAFGPNAAEWEAILLEATVATPTRLSWNGFTWELSNSMPPVVITQKTFIPGSSSWEEVAPSAFNFPDGARRECDYKVITSPTLSGKPIFWYEIVSPSDGTASSRRPKQWIVDGKESPIFTLRAPPNSSATVEFHAPQVELAVDANRDGRIELATTASSDVTSQANPLRFWLNDDDDELVDSSQTGLYTEVELDDRDVAVTHQADWTDNQISPNGTRDLEDFTRLWIDVSSLKDQINTGDIRIGLKWTDISEGAPAVKIFRTNSADETGSLKYLTDVAVANRQVEARAVYDVTLDGNDHTLIEGAGTLILANFEFAKDQVPCGKAYWLLEACKAGKGQLRVVILDKNNVEIGIGPGVWLDLKEPKEFVERWSCGDNSLDAVQPVVRVNSKSGTFAPPVTDEEKDYVLYVHGYNMQEFEKQRWLETTYKRLWHLGYKGRVGSFSWPCSDSALPYDQSEERAWQSAAQLRALLSSLKTAGYRVHVLGHSQGNVVVGEALRQWKEAGNTDALVRTYVASQAAIQAHCYDASAALIPGFAGSLSDDGTPNVYANYPSTGAPYMSAAAMSGAATRFRNFENTDDYALTGNSAGFPVHPGWQLNQRLKPDQGFGYNSVDGFFESTATGSSPLHLPADRFRIFSYGAEGRSFALGSTVTAGVFSGGDYSLRNQLGYGLEHIWHSGQFRCSMAERYQYWIALLDAALIPHLNP